MEEEQLKQKFTETYESFLASGLAPNDAVLKALSVLQQKKEEEEKKKSLIEQKIHAEQLAEEEIGELSKEIFACFSDLGKVNELFVSEEKHAFRMDGEEIRLFYGLVVRKGRLRNAFVNAVETLVLNSTSTHLLQVTSQMTEKDVRALHLLLTANPMALEPEARSWIGGLFKLFYYLPTDLHAYIQQEWCRCFTPDQCKATLDMIQQFLTVRIYGGENLDSAYAACSMLQLLYDINFAEENELKFATYEDFYNDAINAEINLVQDYKRSNIYEQYKIQDKDNDRIEEDEGEEKQQQQQACNVLKRKRLKRKKNLNEVSFTDFGFVLDTASKAHILQIDSDYQQRTQVHDTIMRNFLTGRSIPYLILRVHRENLISDTLTQLVQFPPEQLKKPLKVKFIGEEGVDEGGVQKEFFQVILRELLDPNFGMFIALEESNTLWFNSDSLESTMEFELIGILLGVAIYNAVILDLHFPSFLYKKLLLNTDCHLSLSDLQEAQPDLAKGLSQLLHFPQPEQIEEVFQRTFELSHLSVFGEMVTVDLLPPNGSSTPVTSANVEQYVKLYVDYLLNKSVSKQFCAFYKGFHMVVGGPALDLFRWEELELLICGSPQLDFYALEDVTHCEDGYTPDSKAIKYFWSIVHEFPLEEKKKLLMFCTGSDRVPIRGLSTMVFIISRNGPDSDKLPTAHTCFNHLLLPEYSSREKMKERLELAINQAEGFGLL